MGATRAAIHMAMENILRAPGLVRSLSRCQAPTAPTASAVVKNAAVTVWTSRYGKLGLKMMSSQLPAGTNCPTALMARSEEHTSELQSLMRISYAVFCLKKKNNKIDTTHIVTYVHIHDNHTDIQSAEHSTTYT